MQDYIGLKKTDKIQKCQDDAPCEKQSSARPSAPGIPADTPEPIRLAALDGERSSFSSYLPIKAFLIMASRPIELPGVSGAGWQRTLTGPVKGRSAQQVRGRKGRQVHDTHHTGFLTGGYIITTFAMP